MKLALVLTTPEVTVVPPVALLTGTFADRLSKAKALGYDGVELMPVDPHQLDAISIRTAVEQTGLSVAAVSSGAMAFSAKLTLLHANADIRYCALERLRDLIVFAAQVGAPLVTIGSFRGWCASVGSNGQTVLVSALQAACRWAGQYGVRLVIEPLNRYETDIGQTAQQVLNLIADVGSPFLGILLDTFHVNIEEASPPDTVRRVAETGRLWHVHLGDSNRLPPGQGHFDFPGFVDALRRAGYSSYLSAELLGRPDADTAACLTADYMLPLLQRAAAHHGRRPRSCDNTPAT